MSVWLALDTATEVASVALHDGQAVLAERTWRVARRHTAELAPVVAAVLDTAGLRPADLGGLAVASGPGSYSGLRVGLALAKAIAYAAGLPLVGVPTLDIMAAGLSPPHLPREADLWAVLRAGRGRLVAARYSPHQANGPDPSALVAEPLASLSVRVGPGDWVAGEVSAAERVTLEERGARVLSPAACLRRAGWLADLARAQYATTGAGDPGAVLPTYLGGPP